MFKFRLFLFISCVLIFCLNIYAQDKTKKLPTKDSVEIQKTSLDTLNNKQLKPDTSSIAKSDTVKKDSIEKYIAIKGLDRLDVNEIFSDTISVNKIMFSDYFTFKDILKLSDGFYIADFGTAGQHSRILYEGLSDKNINIFVDGILLENSIAGRPDHQLLPTEEISRIEILPASESFLYGKGGALKTINIITDKHYDSKPYTNLRHIEAPYKTYLTDGIFSQNISRNSNLFFGFNYQVGGNDNSSARLYNSRQETRYNNADYLYMNGRLRLRFNLSNQINLLISDYYFKNERGLNGGIDYTAAILNGKDIYQSIESFGDIRYTNAREKYNKNDFNITLAGKLLKDSLNITKINFGYISENRNYSNLIDTLIPEVQTNITNLKLDLSQNYKLNFNNFLLNAGFSYQSLGFGDSLDYLKLMGLNSSANNNCTRIQFYTALKDNIYIGENVLINLFGRYDFYSDKIFSNDSESENILSLGFNGELRIKNNINAFVEASYNGMRNSVYDNAISYFYLQRDLESNLYYAAGAGFQNCSFKASLNLFSRLIKKPQVCNYNISTEIQKSFYLNPVEQSVYGMGLKAEGSIWKINATLKLDYNINKYDGNAFTVYPKLFSVSEIYFSDTIFTKDIRLKFGISPVYISEFRGLVYYPRENSFGEFNSNIIPEKLIINFLAVLKIQTATLYFSIENIFDTGYMFIPYYPMNDRSFKLSVSWSFLN